MKRTCILVFAIIFLFFSCKSTIGAFKKKATSAGDYALNFLLKEKIPGMSISVSKKDTLIWSQGFGYSNIKNKTKASPKTTQYRLASISKPISAFALAILVDKNELEFDASIYKYLPNYPKKKYDFTIRQIGGHTSGIRSYKGNEFLSNKKLSITEGLDIFKDDPLLFKPQSDYNYSTYSWVLLSEVVQKIAQTPFNNYVENVIFNPLNMASTTLDVADSIMPNRTKFYKKTNAGKIVSGSDVNNEYKVAGGGFLSTSEDLIKFGNEVIHPKLISETTLKELITPQILESGKSTYYGIGFSIGKSKNKTLVYSHSGSGVGASTLLLIYPEEEVVISILTNLSNVPIFDLGKTLESIFLDKKQKKLL